VKTQQGFLYEKNVARELKKYGWVQDSFTPAGAASDKPDLEFYYNRKTYACELKKDLASAGSLVIHHVGNKKYEYGDTGGSDEKEFLKGLGITANLMYVIENKWRGEPFIQKDRDETWVERVKRSGLDLRKRYEHDKRVCPDIYFKLPNNTISKYYNLKNTYYINIANYGFFLLGNTDPANLNNNRFGTDVVPLWDLNHESFLRVRIQAKGIAAAESQEKKLGYVKPGAGQGYQITMEIQFKGVKQSIFNIGPTISKTAVINAQKLILPFQVE
jgi:hypothetical protein